MRTLVSSVLVVLGLLLLPTTAMAGRLDEGMVALEDGDDQRALELLEPYAQAGVADALYGMGRLCMRGKAVPYDPKAAMVWFLGADAQGLVRAPYQIALLYYHGKGVAADTATAVKWVTEGAERGDPEAQWDLAFLYELGHSVREDLAEAVRLLTLAATAGFANAQSALANHYLEGRGVTKDVETAVGWLRRAAEQGDRQAAYNLGRLMSEGTDLPRDPPEALRWFRLAAEQGHEPATQLLALACATGVGVPRSVAEAVRWLGNLRVESVAEVVGDLRLRAGVHRSAFDRDGVLELAIAQLYANGLRVGPDHAEALKSFRKAAEHHLREAEQELARIYLDGIGVPRDELEGSRWLERARPTPADDAFDRGLALERGSGIPVDEAAAVSAYGKAAEDGHAGAQFRLGVLCAYRKGSCAPDVGLGWLHKAADQDNTDAMRALAEHYELGGTGCGGRGPDCDIDYQRMDSARSAEMLERLAKLGDVEAMGKLASRYDRGSGVPEDPERAAHWYLEAERRGVVPDPCRMGMVYAEGRGTPQDHQKAVRYFEQAAKWDGRCQTGLGRAYWRGQGAKKDLAEAFYWLDKAARSWDPEAARERDALAALMTPAQLAKGMKLIGSRSKE